MVSSGVMVIMHRPEGIAKRLDSYTNGKVRGVATGCGGNEILFERPGGSFTFEIEVKAENAG